MKSKIHHQPNSNNGAVGSDNGCRSESPSPPLSPSRRVPRRQRRQTLSRASSFSHRRNLRYFLLLPMIYASGLLMCVGPFSGLVGWVYVPGSVYRSPEIYRKLRDDILSDNSTALEFSSVWKYKRRPKTPKPCPNSTVSSHLGLNRESSPITPSGYLIVEANGGLNQQRSAICNAVAVAGLLNAVLVIPEFEFHSIWKDSSNFGDIYDEDHFISSLEGYVKIVRHVPDEIMSRFSNNLTSIPTLRVQAWATVNYYTAQVYPVLKEHGVIRISPFANRLAMSVPPYIQLLRCIANYKALKFSSPISTLAEKLVDRMVEKSSETGGNYVSVHLRFEEDMVAFSCCLYEGGRAEKSEMDVIRQKSWKGKFKRRDRVIRPDLNRVNGKCPLTPLEVGMMLRGMGFDNKTSIYLASGRIYKPEIHLAPLREMFPRLYTKESLATPEELSPFEGYSSRMAALDYTVSLLSQVFVTTQGGNFPHFLMGHRRFLFGGHAKTVIPDKPKLVLLLQDMDIRWEDFKKEMKVMLGESDRKGVMVPRLRKINRKTSVYTYPLPECECIFHLSSNSSTIHNLGALHPTSNLVSSARLLL
uniref:O-fucosyltransferase family protein n=1 Tax=Noccaea caerulescens TaxID=107243 RepID=A0A1J3K0S4_NOCCA